MAKQNGMKEMAFDNKKTAYNDCIFRHDSLICSLFRIGQQYETGSSAAQNEKHDYKC